MSAVLLPAASSGQAGAVQPLKTTREQDSLIGLVSSAKRGKVQSSLVPDVLILMT